MVFVLSIYPCSICGYGTWNVAHRMDAKDRENQQAGKLPAFAEKKVSLSSAVKNLWKVAELLDAISGRCRRMHIEIDRHGCNL